MPTVNIIRLKPLTLETKRLADAQERIAVALETLLLQAYGIELQPKQVKEDEKIPAVSYASDEETTARLLEEELERLGIKPGVAE
jgi:hypothetical protein